MSLTAERPRHAGTFIPASVGFTKIVRIMKLLSFFMLVCCLAATAKSHAQRITLSEKDVPLAKIFRELHRQAGYEFFYNADLLDKAGKVTVEVRDASIEEVLTLCFKNKPLEFTIENKAIVVKQKTVVQTLPSKSEADMPPVDIHGRIVNEDGNPIEGVSVKIKGTNKGTTTNPNGEFTLQGIDDNAILIFTGTNIETFQNAVKGKTEINLTAKTKVSSMEEVVVNKGYYRVKQRLNTGNVSRITSETIQKQPVSDPVLALVGRVPGLMITQASGIPGASYTIQLRGQNSIANGNVPLFIIDGIPFDSRSLSNAGIGSGAAGAPQGGTPQYGNGGLSPFNNLNPSDIETIEVLKDADATAIYGSRGANGVILITTKKGKAGKTKVDFNLNSGIGNIAHKIKQLSTQQYLGMRREAFKNDGIVPGATDDDVNGNWDTTRFTDWQKLLISNTSHFSNADLSFSGGNSNTTFLIGSHYSKQTTVFPGDFNDQKATFQINLAHQSFNQKFHIQLTAQYGKDVNFLPSEDLTGYVKLAPDAPAIYDQNGNINFQNGTFNNPIASTFRTSKSISDNFMAGLNLVYDIFPGLKIQSNFGYTHTEGSQSNLQPASSFDGAPDPNNRQNDFGTTTNTTWIIEPQINYARMISKGKLDVLFGSTIQRNTFNTLNQTAYGYSSDDLIKDIASASTIYVSYNGYSDYRHNAIFTRLNYNWNDRYIINATGRRDGSSRFGPGNKFGNFGAVGAAWVFSNETFMKKISPILNFGKLRLSYGLTGNDQITDYQYLSTYGANGNYQNTSGLAPNRIASPYFAWEANKKLEAGIELAFLKDRITLGASYYRNRSGNQLVGQPLASQAGFTSIQANLPAVVQNKGVEFELSGLNFKTTTFSWTTSINFSSSRNKLVSFPNLSTNPSYSSLYAVGYPILYTKVYHATGVDRNTGLYTIQDVNGDGALTVTDLQFVKPILVSYFGGILNSFSYKSLKLDIFFQFVKQTGKSAISSLGGGRAGAYNTNFPVEILSRWQKTGDLTNIARFTTGKISTINPSYDNAARSDLYAVDASFIRLKNISLSYTLNSKRLNHAIGLQNARVYLQAQNLLTFTAYKGFDPESQGLNLPPLRMVSLGIQASF